MTQLIRPPYKKISREILEKCMRMLHPHATFEYEKVLPSPRWENRVIGMHEVEYDKSWKYVTAWKIDVLVNDQGNFYIYETDAMCRHWTFGQLYAYRHWLKIQLQISVHARAICLEYDDRAAKIMYEHGMQIYVIPRGAGNIRLVPGSEIDNRLEGRIFL